MLRSIGSRAIATGLLSIAASAGWGTGCAGSKPTELVPGALTQIAVPYDLAGIRIDVLVGGVKVSCNSYRASDGTLKFPGTLGINDTGSSGVVTIEIAAYDADGINGGSDFANCESPIAQVGTAGVGAPKVIRSSIQSFVPGHELFLPISLSYSCWGNASCGQDATASTCKANQCGTTQTDSSRLPDFDPSLVDGTQDCFDPTQCFNPVVSATLLDAPTCLYEVPPGETGGSGLNVRIVYQDYVVPMGQTTPVIVPTNEEEILNEEPTGSLAEGYIIPDPAHPKQFQLAPGLCNMVQAANNPTPPMGAPQGKIHTISDVQVSTTCPSKTLYLPICSQEQNLTSLTADGGTNTSVVCDAPITLEPAPSVVYLVMDSSQVMDGAFGEKGYATAMGLSLDNPVFKRMYVAFEFTDDDTSACSSAQYLTPNADPDGAPSSSLDFRLAQRAQPLIAQQLLAPMLNSTGQSNLHLTPALAMGGAYQHLQSFSSQLGPGEVNVAALMLFTNRMPVAPGTVLNDAGEASDGGSQFAGEDCPVTGSYAQNIEGLISAAHAAAIPMQTYFVVLNNDPGTPPPLPFYKGIVSDLQGSVGNDVQVLDATSSSLSTALGSFVNPAVALGTCLYELPPGVDTNATVDFTIPIPLPDINPVAPVPVHVPYLDTCSASTATTANGWSLEAGTDGGGGHLRICGMYCSELRTTVVGVAASALTALDAGTGDGGLPPAPVVPVTVSMPCADGGP